MDILDTRENLNAMVLKHEQQIKDIATHLLELKQLVKPISADYEKGFDDGFILQKEKVGKREWVGLTNDEVNNFALGCQSGKSVQSAIYEAEAKLREKNG